jgi:hypothetical protein
MKFDVTGYSEMEGRFRIRRQKGAFVGAWTGGKTE